MSISEESSDPPGSPGLLLLSVFLVATCGLIYELIAGALASYLLGDSIFQFSTIIGDYLFAMGVGSYLAQYLGRKGPEVDFVRLQNGIALIGGFSAPLMHLAFSYTNSFRFVLYLLVFLVGLLVGAEIPLLMTVLKKHYGFRQLVSRVLALDYLGALLASLIFPLVLIPQLGLIRTSLACGLVNSAVAWVSLELFRVRGLAMRLQTALVAALLVAGVAASDLITRFAEEGLYADPIILSRTTSYQRLIVTRGHQETRLYINGNLQFSSRDEYRYHEALVHPALCSLERPAKVLILGGGDGLAAREVLRYPQVSTVTLVDLDPAMTALFRDHRQLAELNQGALADPRLRVVNADAFIWARQATDRYDAILVDFPDPSNYAVGKLYTQSFYAGLRPLLKPEGALAVQCTSPLFARQSYWCIQATLRAAGWKVRPYHVYVPSFGEWGFALAGLVGEPRPAATRLPAGLRYLGADTVDELFRFPLDMSPVPTQINRLFDQVLVRYYESDWRSLVE